MQDPQLKEEFENEVEILDKFIRHRNPIHSSVKSSLNNHRKDESPAKPASSIVRGNKGANTSDEDPLSVGEHDHSL